MAQEPISTLVMFHDLLGFGSALSASGGRFDSAMGNVAFQRIIKLRQTLESNTHRFPEKTEFFHYNDAVVAIIDAQANVTAEHISPSSQSVSIDPLGYFELLKFVGAASTIHDETRKLENQEKLGPGGRTFVILGKRWNLPPTDNNTIQKVDKLHANLAFAEAYAADNSGKSGGFDHPRHSSMYINDHIDTAFSMLAAKRQIFRSHRQDLIDPIMKANSETCELFWPALDELIPGTKPKFPENICLKEHEPAKLEIFHRSRVFKSVTAHYARKLCELDIMQDKSVIEQKYIENISKHIKTKK